MIQSKYNEMIFKTNKVDDKSDYLCIKERLSLRHEIKRMVRRLV